MAPLEIMSDRTWPGRMVDRAPLWASVDLRDGNQALANPMDTRRKAAMFDLLVRMGFKEIEVGYPSASAADFSFVQNLVSEGRIPDDVTISVFTPARLDLIDRTFESIRGVDRAVVHLCMATACLWRTVVFSMTADELRECTIRSAEAVARLADAMPRSRLRFQYSPETFNVTEPDFALEVCDAVTSVWDASPDRPVILNLPTTVETDSPNVFADQVEWMHRRLSRRESWASAAAARFRWLDCFLELETSNIPKTCRSCQLSNRAGDRRRHGGADPPNPRCRRAVAARLQDSKWERVVAPFRGHTDVNLPPVNGL